MGMFDKMFGGGAGVAEHPETEKRFNDLKQKYTSVLNTIQQQGVRVSNLHVQDNKLFIKGEAPSQDVKNKVWDQIKLIDPSFSDLTADIGVDPDAQDRSRTAASGPSAPRPGGQMYTVQPGDTLSKIAKEMYGNAGEYMTIFNANRDKLSDPDKIQSGQVLTIPPK